MDQALLKLAAIVTSTYFAWWGGSQEPSSQVNLWCGRSPGVTKAQLRGAYHSIAESCSTEDLQYYLAIGVVIGFSLGPLLDVLFYIRQYQPWAREALLQPASVAEANRARRYIKPRQIQQ